MNNKFSIDNSKLDRWMFFSSYFIYLFFTILDSSFFSTYITNYTRAAMILCVFIIVLKELIYTKLKIRELIYLTICLSLNIILFLHTNGYAMFPLFFLLYGARKIKFESIAKFTIIVTSLFSLLIVMSAKSGIILDYISYSNGRIRDYLGFRYALFPSILLFNITCLIVYIDKKNNILKYIFLILINYIVFKYTNSRLSFYLILLFLVISFFIKKYPVIIRKRKIIQNILSLSYIICCVLSLYVIFTYDGTNRFINQLNIDLEDRISLGKSSLDEFPINLLGQKVEYTGAGLSSDGTRGTKKYNYVDCLYLNMLEKYGLIFSIIYIGIMTYSLFKLKKNKQYILLIILAFCAVRGIIDDLGMYLYYNTFWFAIGECIIPNKLKEENK